MLDPLAIRVAARHLVAAGYFNVGDVVLFGKYKNKRGKIVSFGSDKWGNPTIEVEPVPKGRKENKVFGLYRIWRADVKEKALAEQKQAKDLQEIADDLELIEVVPENPCLTGDPRNCRHEVCEDDRYNADPEAVDPMDPNDDHDHDFE